MNVRTAGASSAVYGEHGEEKEILPEKMEAKKVDVRKMKDVPTPAWIECLAH